MTGRFAVILAGALLASLGADVPAEQVSRPERARETGGRRGEAFRMIDAYVVGHLQESLDLGNEQYGRVVPLVTRLQAERRDYFLARARTLREMRRMLREGGTSEKRVLDQLQQLKRLDAERPARLRAAMETLDAALTPLQQAKFRLLEAEVEHRMRDLMARVRPSTPGTARPQGNAEPQPHEQP